MRRVLALTLLALAACSSWHPVARHERWTLYERPGEPVAAGRFAEAFDPAFLAVEAALGPFEGRVDVHAWDGTRAASPEGAPAGTGVHQVEGIGPARIQAYHSRGGGAFHRSGIFMGKPEAGTAVHELVHARYADLDVRLPLWFEEGVAGVLGDGVLAGGVWTVDGLACWPLRVLREEALTDEDLERLLALEATDRSDVRDNVLVHFVGWAVVFDLWRDSGGELRWEEWLTALRDAPPSRVRFHLERALAPETTRAWLERLHHPRREVRLATAKGLWKLREPSALDALLERLEVERDPEVRVGLAVNALAAAGDLPLSWRRWRAVEAALRGALRGVELVDPHEQRAALDLYRAYGRGGDRQAAHEALLALARFWEE